MALPTLEKVLVDYISHQGGSFNTKQAEALRTTLQKFIDEIEAIDERVTTLEEAP